MTHSLPKREFGQAMRNPAPERQASMYNPSPYLRFPVLSESAPLPLRVDALKLPAHESEVPRRDQPTAVMMAIQSGKSGKSGTCAVVVWEAISRPGTRYVELTLD